MPRMTEIKEIENEITEKNGFREVEKSMMPEW